MRIFFILIIMIALHIFADYHLQGILATLKQKDKWPHKYPNDSWENKYGYTAALAAHSFEWSFVVTLPCLASIYHACAHNPLAMPDVRAGTIYILFLALNTLFHYVVDDLKANDRKIGLVTDQCFHIIQILCTWLFWTQFVGW